MRPQPIHGRKILGDLAAALGLDMPVKRIVLDVSIDAFVEAYVEFSPRSEVPADKAAAIVAAIRKHTQGEP
jgi:hypothetical protein